MLRAITLSAAQLLKCLSITTPLLLSASTECGDHWTTVLTTYTEKRSSNCSNSLNYISPSLKALQSLELKGGGGRDWPLALAN